MKYFYIGLLILSLLLCAYWLSTREVQGRTRAMLLPLHRALEAFRGGDAAGQERAVQTAQTRWRASEPVLESLLSHDRVLGVTDDLERLAHAAQEEFEQICVGLMAKLRRIGEMDLPKLRNIL